MTEQRKSIIKTLREQNFSYNAIAKAMGVTVATVKSYCQRAGLAGNRKEAFKSQSDTPLELCADICRRNGKKRLVWIADREKALRYEVKEEEMSLTVHRWFANKSCPGNWLIERLGSLADEVNGKLGM